MAPVARTLSFDSAVKKVAAEEHMSPHMLRVALRRFIETGALVPRTPERITAADPRHPLYLETGPSLKVAGFIFDAVKESQEEDSYLSLDTLRADIYEELNEEIPRSTLAYWMKDLTIEWGLKKKTGLTPEQTNLETQRFVRQYAEAWKEQEEGKAVIVWMDESYIHVGLSTTRGWFIRGASKSRNANRFHAGGKGKRYIIIHAICPCRASPR